MSDREFNPYEFASDPFAGERLMFCERIADLSTQIAAKDAEIAALREALTPSAETKSAYIGEFRFEVSRVDEFGDELSTRYDVPWTTIKEIMAAILARAALEMSGGGK
jgi:hypothetical protein